MFSLGREPQVQRCQPMNEPPKGATDSGLRREPAGGSETWPRSGIAGHRPLAGDGASRRPKAVHNPRVGTANRPQAPGGGDRFVLRREPIASAPHFCRRSAAFSFVLALILGLTPQAMYLSPLRGSGSHDNFSSGLDELTSCRKGGWHHCPVQPAALNTSSVRSE